MIYKYLPDVEIGWRDVWIGAAVTSVLFNGGKYLIGLYLGQAAIGSAFGAAGSFAVLLVWIYYSALISFFGAEFTQVYARRHGRKIQPQWHARPDRENGGSCLRRRRTKRAGHRRLASDGHCALCSSRSASSASP